MHSAPCGRAVVGVALHADARPSSHRDAHARRCRGSRAGRRRARCAASSLHRDGVSGSSDHVIRPAAAAGKALRAPAAGRLLPWRIGPARRTPRRRAAEPRSNATDRIHPRRRRGHRRRCGATSTPIPSCASRSSAPPTSSPRRCTDWGIPSHRGLGTHRRGGHRQATARRPRAVGLRADIDALPMTEHNTLRPREPARRQDARLRPRRPHRDAAGARPSTWRGTATSTARSTWCSSRPRKAAAARAR